MFSAQTGESLIHQLFDAQPDSAVWFCPVFTNDDASAEPVDFEAQYCNRKAAEILGTTPDAVIGARLLSTALMDADSRRRILDQCLEVWQSGKPVEFTYHSPGLDRYFNVQRSRVYNGILSITRDRTAEVKAELERSRQEERYRQILDTAADGILLFESLRDDDGNITDFRIIHANRRAYEIGALPQHTIGNSLLTLLPHLRDSEQMEWHKGVALTGIPMQFETTFRKPDGAEYGWFIVSLTRLGDGVISNFVDVTERKRNERKIEEQRTWLQQVVDSSVNGMLVCSAVRDENGEVKDLLIDLINPAFTQIIGYTAEEAVGNTYLNLFPSAATNGLFDFNRSILESKTVVRHEIYYKGEQIDAWFDVSTSSFEPDGLLITFTEISERKRLQLELEQKLEELRRSNQSLEEFAYAASHDLQEPLRKIHFFSDRLKSRLDPESDSADMFERMESATTRMRNLIDDLLAYSRLSVAPQSFVPVALNTVVQQVLQDLEAALHESGAQVQTDRLPVIRGDERQLHQLFQNLLSNALKYRAADRVPQIEVRYRSTTERLEGSECFVIEISDNGIGFEQQYADKIFQVFQRLHGRSEYAGSGVGLAIARKVVLNHKGQIAAQGKPGEGATFRLLIPKTMLA